MKNNLLLFMLLLSNFLMPGAFGQDLSEVKIKDLHLMNRFDPANPQASLTDDTYDLQFKASAVPEIVKIHVLLGTEKGLGDVRTSEIIYSQGISSGSITLQGDYTVTMLLQLTAPEAQQMKWGTLWIEDENGKFSEKLYFLLKPDQP